MGAAGAEARLHLPQEKPGFTFPRGSTAAAVAAAQQHRERGEETGLSSESTAARPRVLGDQQEDLGFYYETEGKLLRVQSR